jgi:hypothetical protein
MRWLIGLLAVVALEAQTAASIQILSDSSQVLVGRTLRMRAVVRDAGGNLIENANVTWTSNNTTNATISSTGVVTANRLAVVRIGARTGSVSAETAIQSIPSRVAIEPGRTEVAVGSTQQFSATAFDADDKPIPGVTWSWSVTNLRQGGSQTARISTSGLMTAIAEGSNFVWATFTYGDVQTGLQRQWVAFARVETSVPRTYTLRRLYNNLLQMRSKFEFRPRQSMLWATDNNELYFNASLDGVAGGLMQFKDGQFKLVSAAGMPRFASGTYANEFFAHSITRSGRILSYEDTNGNGRQLSLGNADGLLPFFSNNTVLIPGTEASNSVVITRNSLTSGGQTLFRAAFRFEGDPTNYTGIFRGFNNRISELLLSTRDNPAELPGTGAITIDGDFGISDDGVAVYSAQRGGVRVFYRHPPGGDRKKLIATNDPLLDSTVRSFNGGRANAPTFWVEETNGTVILAVTLNNSTSHYVAFDKAGKATSLQYSASTGILWHHPEHGTLIHGNPFNNRGNGVYLWKPGSELKTIFLYSRPAVAGANIEDVDSGVVTSDGRVFLMGRTSTAFMAIAEMAATPGYVVYSGQTVDVQAPVNITNFIYGAKSGNPQVMAGGTTGSVVEFNGTDFTPRLLIGEKILGNMYYGGFTGSTGNIRRAPNGDTYAIVPSGVVRITGPNTTQLVIPFPLRDGSFTYNLPNQLEINSAGDILMQGSTSAGDNRIYIWSNGNVTSLINMSATAATASTIDNRIASGFDSFAFTDDGRVLASLRFRNLGVPVLYLWANQTWTRIAEPNLTVVGPHRITGIANLHRSAQGRLFATLTIQAGGNILTEWKGDQLEILVNNSSIMPNGQVTTSVANVDVNRRGDLLFQQSNAGNNFLLVRPADAPDKIRQVVNFFRPTPDGDYIVRIFAIEFRDDGTVYFLGVTADDETVLYEAKPID